MSSDERDQTIAELHKIRRQIAAKFGGDIFAINTDAQTRTEASGRRIVRKRKAIGPPTALAGESLPIGHTPPTVGRS